MIVYMLNMFRATIYGSGFFTSQSALSKKDVLSRYVAACRCLRRHFGSCSSFQTLLQCSLTLWVKVLVKAFFFFFFFSYVHI